MFVLFVVAISILAWGWICSVCTLTADIYDIFLGYVSILFKRYHIYIPHESYESDIYMHSTYRFEIQLVGIQ